MNPHCFFHNGHENIVRYLSDTNIFHKVRSNNKYVGGILGNHILALCFWRGLNEKRFILQNTIQTPILEIIENNLKDPKILTLFSIMMISARSSPLTSLQFFCLYKKFLQHNPKQPNALWFKSGKWVFCYKIKKEFVRKI